MNLRKLGIKDINYEDIGNKDLSYFLSNIKLNINNNIISYQNSHIYDNHYSYICLTGFYKKDHKCYALNAGKSNNLDREIRKFYRIISQPKKQNINYDYSRWYYIANDYINFKILILCIDISEQEAF